MYQQKGFSLTEVLVALLLVTSLALSLLQQQWQCKQLLNQLILKLQGAFLLDQIEETITAQSRALPFIYAPYHLEIEEKNQELFIKLTWYKRLGLLSRQYRLREQYK